MKHLSRFEKEDLHEIRVLDIWKIKKVGILSKVLRSLEDSTDSAVVNPSMRIFEKFSLQMFVRELAVQYKLRMKNAFFSFCK